MPGGEGVGGSGGEEWFGTIKVEQLHGTRVAYSILHRGKELLHRLALWDLHLEVHGASIIRRHYFCPLHSPAETLRYADAS